MSELSGVVEQLIIEQESNWMEAVRRQAVAAVEQILASKFALTSTLPRAFDKQQYLSDLPLVRTHAFHFRDSVLHVYGDVVVVRTRLQWDATFDG